MYNFSRRKGNHAGEICINQVTFQELSVFLQIKLDSIRNADGNLILHGVQIVITSDEKKYKCGSCSVSYKTRCALISHIRHLHAKIPRPAPKKAYGPQTEGTSHRSKSQIMDDGRQLFCGVEIRSCGNEQENRFQCGRCSRTWKSKGNVMAHIKMRHPGNKF